MMSISINIIICVVTLLMFVKVSNIQKKLILTYTGDGHTGIRKMGIINVYLLSGVTVFRVIYFSALIYYSSELNTSPFANFVYYCNSIMLFTIAVFNYKFYNGNEFKFLSKK